MAKRDPRIDAYIAKSAAFAQPVLKHLRELIHEACPDVVETLKWSMPFFDYRGSLCHFAAFKQHCAFGFWKGKLMFESEARHDEAMGHFWSHHIAQGSALEKNIDELRQTGDEAQRSGHQNRQTESGTETSSVCAERPARGTEEKQESARDLRSVQSKLQSASMSTGSPRPSAKTRALRRLVRKQSNG